MIGKARSNSLARTLLITALALPAACAINPVTGERELALISEPQEIEMGRQAAEQVATTIGLVDDAALQEYISELGTRLASRSERPDLPWSFAVVDDPTPNAFALPGGYIFVTRGLLTLLNSEAEIAAVIGHEIGHVTARHSVNQLSRAQLAQLGLGIGAIAAPETIGEYGDLANFGLGLLFLSYGREDERQADSLGFDYMLDHGYDVTEMQNVFAALEAAGDLAGQSPIPTWLASHPSGPERIEALQERVAALPPGQTGQEVRQDAYFARIDGLAYGENPRQGYFEGDRFYHPELEFSLLIPESWQRRNTASAVMALHPSEQAALQLTLAPGEGAREAAIAFLAAEGVNDLGTSSAEVNGQTAMISRFAAAAEGGEVRGLAAHIEHGGNVYRLVVYGPAGAFDAHRPAAEEIIGSFDEVTDRDVLRAEVPHIEIIELDRAMSLEEFAREYPSAIPLEELAVINQASPGTGFEAGAELKTVAS